MPDSVDIPAAWIQPYGNKHAHPIWVGSGGKAGGVGKASPKKATTLSDVKAAQAERKTLYEQHAKLRALRNQGKVSKENVKKWEEWQSKRIDHLKQVEAGKAQLEARSKPPSFKTTDGKTAVRETAPAKPAPVKAAEPEKTASKPVETPKSAAPTGMYSELKTPREVQKAWDQLEGEMRSRKIPQDKYMAQAKQLRLVEEHVKAADRQRIADLIAANPKKPTADVHAGKAFQPAVDSAANQAA